MSFSFETNLTNLRSGEDYATFIQSSTNWQNSPEYHDFIVGQHLVRLNAIRDYICNMIMDHFNNIDLNNVDINNTTLTVYVGDLMISDINNLVTALQSKGYICNISVDNTKLIVTCNV